MSILDSVVSSTDLQPDRAAFIPSDLRTGALGDGEYVQWVGFSADGTRQPGRKWYISPHACRQEIVNTILLALTTYVTHEARESLLYKGTQIGSPHLDYDELARTGIPVELRTPAGAAAE